MRKFEKIYTTVYPEQAMDSGVGYQMLEVALTAEILTPKPHLPVMDLKSKKPSSNAEKGSRKVYYRGKKRQYKIYEMDALQAGNVVEGPAIVEHPATTLYVPPN